MFQTGEPNEARGGAGTPGGAKKPARLTGEVFPLAPGAPDPSRLAQVLAEFEAGCDPWLEEFVESGWVGPSPDEELEAFLRHEGQPASDADHQEPVDLVAALAQHPGAQVPARMPSVED